MAGQQAKDIACQDLLAQRPACYGFVRRKTAFQGVGEKIESKIKVIGRKVSNKMPWKQQFMILHQNKLYIYNKETDTRAQKILTLSNFCKFLAAPEEHSKEVPWPFVLRPNGSVDQLKSEFFCATSQDELQKWEEAVTPGLGEEENLSEESDDNYDDIEDIDKSPKPQNRFVPATPDRQQGGPKRNDRALPPVPSGDNETGLRSRKVPAIPGTETKSESAEKPTKKPPPPIAIKRGERPPTMKKPQVPLPSPKPALPPMKEEPVKDDLTYELGYVDAAMWNSTTDEAQEFMKQSGLPEGLFLIRKSTDGSGYTLIVICHGLPCKFKIEEDAEHKVKMGSTSFATLEALIVHFCDTNLPNKTTPLTKAHSNYKRN